MNIKKVTSLLNARFRAIKQEHDQDFNTREKRSSVRYEELLNDKLKNDLVYMTLLSTQKDLKEELKLALETA